MIINSSQDFEKAIKAPKMFPPRHIGCMCFYLRGCVLTILNMLFTDRCGDYVRVIGPTVEDVEACGTNNLINIQSEGGIILI